MQYEVSEAACCSTPLILGSARRAGCQDSDHSRRASAACYAVAQEFAEFAYARDVSEGVQGRTPLELPYAIDGDRVGNLTIKLMFNKARRLSHGIWQHHCVPRSTVWHPLPRSSPAERHAVCPKIL